MDARIKLDVGHAVTVGPCLYNCDRLSEWFREQLDANGHVDTAIGVVRRGEVMGAFGFNEYYDDDGTICIHIVGTPGWFSREAVSHAFFYAFDTLGCDRITGMIIASNRPSLRLARAAGFVREGRMKKAHRRTEDVLIMRQTKRQWKKSRLYIEVPDRDVVPVFWHYSQGKLKVISSGQESTKATSSARPESSREAASAI